MKTIFLLVFILFTPMALAECDDLHRDITSAQRGLDFKKARGSSPDGFLSHDAFSADREYERRIVGASRTEIEREEVIRQIRLHVTNSGYDLFLDPSYAKDLLKFVRNGDARAQFCASVLYEFGVGVTKSLVIAYGLAATAVAQNPPFGQYRRDQIASSLNSDQQAQGIEAANRLMRSITNLYDQPTTIIIK